MEKTMFLRNDLWQHLAPLLLGSPSTTGRNGNDNRLFIEAVLWQVKHQRRWSDLPAEYGCWNNCYVRFRRWNESDVWRDLAMALNNVPELASEIEKIAAYGALYDMHAKARQRRKESRENRKKHISHEESFS